MNNHPPPIRVLVRIRPSENDNVTVNNDEDDILQVQLNSDANTPAAPMLCLRSRDGSSWQGFKFDGILDGRATQVDVMTHFDDMIGGVLRGISCTAFAYGQTSTGKSYSLIGRGFDDAFESRSRLPWSQVRNDIYSQQEHGWGIIPRTIYALFSRLEEDESVVSFTVKCSWFQIYNDKVHDLLAASGKSSSKTGLPIREDTDALGGVNIQGLMSVQANSPEQAIKLLYQGGRRRTVRETSCNERSSRSHAIFRLTVEVCAVDSENSPVTRRSLVNLVDCAGSERWGSDERSKLSAAELTKINSSLSALGNCVSALARNQKHIPFRSSALTRILKDCLGGGARAMIIATVSSTPSSRFETASTLAFASRALQLGKILPEVKVDEIVDDSVLLRQAKAEIRRLRNAMDDNAGNRSESESDVESGGWEGKVRIATAAIHDVVEAVEAGKISPYEVGIELKSFFKLSRRLQDSVKEQEVESSVSEETMQVGEDTSERQDSTSQDSADSSSSSPIDPKSNNSPDKLEVKAEPVPEPLASPRSLAEARHEELCSSFDDQIDTSSTPEPPPPRTPAHKPLAACERHDIEDCYLCRIDAANTASASKQANLRNSTMSSPPPSNRRRPRRQRQEPSTEPRPSWTHRTDSTRRHSSIPAPSVRRSHIQRSSPPKLNATTTASGSRRQRFKSTRPTQSSETKPRKTAASFRGHHSAGAAKKRPTSSRIRPEDMKSAKDRARMAIAEASRVLAHM